jgi:hypothetical protein
MMPLNRFTPARPVSAMKTYGLAAPQTTHYRRATCKEVDCPNYVNGWRSGFDVTKPEAAEAARIVRLHSGRLFTIEEIKGGPLNTVQKVIFTFGPGQECFLPHRVALERDPILYVRHGDWRGNDTGYKRMHANPTDWVDDFGEHQQRLADRLAQG